MALTNGDFEEGDLTGWTPETYGLGAYTATATVTAGAKRSGTYGARLYVSSQSSGYGFSGITTNLDSTGWDYLVLYLKANNLVRNYSGYSELSLMVTMLVESTPTSVTLKTIQIPDFVAWRPMIILLSELEQLRIDNSGTWDSSTIPLRIGIFNNCDDATPQPIEIFVDDVSVEDIPAFSNGGFEDGDLTGWYNDSYVYQNSADELGGTSTTVVSTTEKHAGTYSAKLNCTFLETITDGAIYAAIMRPMSMTDFVELSFWYKITDATGGNPKFLLQAYTYNSAYGVCDWVTVFELSGGAENFTVGDWIQVEMTKAEMETALSDYEFLDTTIFRLQSNFVNIPS